MKRRKPNPDRPTKPINRQLALAEQELRATAMGAAQERASCAIGIDNEEPRAVQAYRMNPNRGPLWRRLEGNAHSRSR